jgi:hypothetical protein
MLNVLYRLVVTNRWFEDEETTIERIGKYQNTSTLLKLEFLSSLSLDLSINPVRDSTYVILDQQEEYFGGITYRVAVERFIKFLSEPKSLI